MPNSLMPQGSDPSAPATSTVGVPSLPEIPTARANTTSEGLPAKVKHADPAGAVIFPLMALTPKVRVLQPTPESRRWMETSNLPVWVLEESLTCRVQVPLPPEGTSHAAGPP